MGCKKDKNKCPDPSLPTVDETAIECCEHTPSNCVVTSKYQDFFKIGKGRTLTFVIDKIAKIVKALKLRVESIEVRHNYRIDELILNQSSTNDPVATYVKSEITGTPVLTRTGPGKFEIVKIGAYTAGKTFVQIKGFNIGWGEKVKAYWGDVNTIRVESGNSTDYIDDGIITNMPIEIKVYD